MKSINEVMVETAVDRNFTVEHFTPGENRNGLFERQVGLGSAGKMEPGNTAGADIVLAMFDAGTGNGTLRRFDKRHRGFLESRKIRFITAPNLSKFFILRHYRCHDGELFVFDHFSVDITLSKLGNFIRRPQNRIKSQKEKRVSPFFGQRVKRLNRI